MNKKLLLLGLLMLVAVIALAQAIPYAADSKEYSDYKLSLIGKGWIPAPEAISPSGLMPLAYKQQNREGLLVPLDDTFIQALGGNDDGYTSVIAIPFVFDFYGSQQSTFYINNNGNISFGEPYSTYTPTGFPIDEFPMLSAFWADVDTRPTASGKVYYKVEPNRVIVIWAGVGYFSSHTDKLNTFEVVFTDGTDSSIGLGNNVAFSYGDMQWTTGDVSGGANGFGGTPATVGLNKGDGIHYGLIGRFDHEGTDYNGPGGSASGVSYLDNQLFTFNTMEGNNIPPIFTGVPLSPLQMQVGDSTSVVISSVSPLPTNTVSAVVQHNFSSGFQLGIVEGNPCYINMQITANTANLGVHTITIVATDSGEPPLSSTTSFQVEISSDSEYLLVANSAGRNISVVETSSNTVFGPFLTGQLGTGSLLDIVVLPNNQEALVSNFQSMRVYHLNISNPLEPSVIASYYLGFSAEDISLSQNGRFAIVADGGTSTQLAVLDLQSRTTVQIINIAPRYAQGVSLGADGKVLVNDYEGNLVYQYQLDLQTGILSDTGQSVSVIHPFNTAIHPSGNHAIVCGNGSLATKVISLNQDNTLSVVQILDIPGSQSALYSLDGTKALLGVVGTTPNTLNVYDVQTDGTLMLNNSYNLSLYNTGGYYGVDPLAITSDNNLAYIGNMSSTEQSLNGINLRTGELSLINTGSPAGLAMFSTGLRAQFTYAITVGSQVQFTNQSIGTPTSYLWSFGDGGTSTEANPLHAYQSSGIYTVSLTAYRGSQSDTVTQTISVVFDNTIHLTLAGSPYQFNTPIVILPHQTLSIDSGVVLNFAPTAGILIQGIINATNATFTGNEVSGWKGIVINSSQSPQVFIGCTILHAIQAMVIDNSSFSINTLLIDKSHVFTDELGLWIKGASNMELNNVQVFNYSRGIVFNNEDLRITSNATLTNIRIRNTSSSIRPDSKGLEVTGAVGLSISDAVIEEYDEGIYWDAQGTSNYRTTPTLTNIRIRNTSSSIRSGNYGLRLINMGSVIAIDDSIGGYTTGLMMENTETNRTITNATLTNIRIRNTSSSIRTDSFGAKLSGNIAATVSGMEITDYQSGFFFQADSTDTRTVSTATLTNIRIRNTNSSVRTDSYGMKLMGNVSAAVSDMEVEEYDYGLFYKGTGEAFDRTTPTLTNIRIRNTSSSVRNASYGIKLMDLASVIVENDTIDGYSTGLSLQSTLQNRIQASATLTNIRIRNTSSSVRSTSLGLNLLGGIVAQVDGLDIEDCTTGVYYEGDGSALRTTPTLTNIRIRNTSSSVREPVQGIIAKNLAGINLSKCTIYPSLDDTRNNIEGNAIQMEAVHNAHISQNTIWGFEKGLNLLDSPNANFTQNVIWTNAGELAAPIVLVNSDVAVTHNDISYVGGLYPGAGNLDKDPKFADPEQGNFYLKPRSPLRDTAIGSHTFDFEALAALQTHTMHPGWNMMGVPYLTRPTENTPTVIFADDLSPFYATPTYTSIVQLNTNAMPDSLGHVVFNYTSSYNTPAVVRSAVGYWVRNAGLTNVAVDVYGLLDDGSYNLELPSLGGSNNGWYLLSNPYDRPLKWSDGSMMPSGQLAPWAYVYNYNANTYQMVTLANEGEIPPWSGFFVKTNAAADMLYLNYPAASAPSRQTPEESTCDSGLIASANPLPDWEFVLQAGNAEFRDKITVGVAASASNLYDGMDVPELPQAPFIQNSAPDLSVLNNDWSVNPGIYTRDIRSREGSLYSWDLLLNVESLLVDGKLSDRLVLGKDALSRLPEGYRFSLINPANGQSVDICTETMLLDIQIDMAAADPANSPWLIPLKLEASKLNAVAEQDVDIISTRNYPNPFNPSTTISYSLGKDSAVSLEIYNVKGQLVNRLINGSQARGEHSAVWNGRDSQGREVASGFYFYRLTAGGSTINKKILMMK